MDKEFRRSIETTLIFMAAIVMLVGAFSMGVVLTEKSSGAMKKLINDYMLSVSDTAADMLDADELKKLDYGSEGSPGSDHILEILECFNDNIELEDIYCINIKEDGSFYFVFDLTDEDPAEFGEPLLAVTDALRKAAKGESAVDEEPYEDAWGRFYSSYSPVFDSDGEIAGIVAVDFDADWYDKQVKAVSFRAFLIGLICLVMGAVVVVIINTSSRKSLRRAHIHLNELADNVEELMVEVGNLSPSELNKPVKKVRMVYEDDGLDALGEKISGMQEALKEQIAHIQENAFIDGMTGAKNRNSYLEDVDIAEEAIKEGSMRFSVAVFDVTGLKAINDIQGHECGDRAITDAAKVLTEAFGRDNVYRVGGDEFVAAVRFATASDMKKSFSRIDTMTEAINSRGGQYESQPLVLAKGYSVFDPKTDKSFADVFARADKKMYADKAEYYKKHNRQRREN